MKINITKKEYRLLIDMLYLADWMMNSNIIGDDQKHSQHEKLRKKFLSYYKEMEAEDIIEYCNKLNDYYEVQNYDEYLHEIFIDSYDDETFWAELISRLSKRDAIKEIGIEKLTKMKDLDRAMKIGEFREKYENEFEQHGLKHVKIGYEEIVKN